MKIIAFTGGLGNQLFQFAFYEYIMKQYPKEKIYGYYNKKLLSDHNGLEIQKVFDIKLPKSNYFVDLIVLILRIISKVFKRCNLIAYSDTDIGNAIYLFGGWFDKKYYAPFDSKLKFRDLNIDKYNLSVLENISKTYSVAIHIRRGDYCTPQYIEILGNVCNIDYYNKGISFFCNQSGNVVFFIFSDDMQWVKKNLCIPNAVYVTQNNGKNSYFDMFLMSKCKGLIIANSTFSYWAAVLNENKPTVIYPNKWILRNGKSPKIFDKKWIGY
jgi:hypothetical protein